MWIRFATWKPRAARCCARVVVHSVFVNRVAGKVSAVPRHREISDILARNICKDLDLESGGSRWHKPMRQNCTNGSQLTIRIAHLASARELDLLATQGAAPVAKVDPKVNRQIRSAVSVELVDLSTARNVKPLTSHECDYRLRVGSWRVLFNFDGMVHVVSIEEVRRRDERTY